MKPRSLLAMVVGEVAESLQAGLGLAWLLVVWVALHVALGALCLAKVLLLVVRPSPRPGPRG